MKIDQKPLSPRMSLFHDTMQRCYEGIVMGGELDDDEFASAMNIILSMGTALSGLGPIGFTAKAVFKAANRGAAEAESSEALKQALLNLEYARGRCLGELLKRGDVEVQSHG